MDSLEILEFKESIIAYANEKEFPAYVKVMVLEDILNNFKTQSDEEIRNALAKRDEEASKKSKSKKEE